MRRVYLAFAAVIDGPFYIPRLRRRRYKVLCRRFIRAAAERRNPKSSKIIPPVERVTCCVGLKFCVRLRAIGGGGSVGGGGGGCMALTDAELIIKVKIKPSITEAIKNRTGNVEYFHCDRLSFVYLHNLLFV